MKKMHKKAGENMLKIAKSRPLPQSAFFLFIFNDL